jgi:hypothetical protein
MPTSMRYRTNSALATYMRKLIKSIPLLRSIAGFLYRLYYLATGRFKSSDQYWKERYQKGGNSGDGSYGKLAEFKADILNSFVSEQSIKSVIEFGSGDGSQLSLAHYPKYTGVDISPDAINRCRARYANDITKEFILSENYRSEKAELSLSLDVIYHLVEDSVFNSYMEKLFAAATRFVIVYSSNTSEQHGLQLPHVRHRTFTHWVEQNMRAWTLIKHEPNPYNGDALAGEIMADFFIFATRDNNKA